MLPEIYGEDAPPGAARCRLPLLLCVGSLSEAMHHQQRFHLPIARAAHIPLKFFEEKDLRFTRRHGQGWVRSTPEYEKRYETVMRVPLPYGPVEDLLDLKDLCGLDA